MELHNNDQWSVDYTRNFEFLRQPFDIVPGRRIAAGPYELADVRSVSQFGPQRRDSGSATFRTGSFYDGRNTEIGYRGSVEISPRFNLEPRITLNWVDPSAGRLHDAPGEHAHDVHVLARHGLERARAVQLDQRLAQLQRALPLGVSLRQRCVHRLHRRPGHLPAARLSGSGESHVGGEDDAAISAVTTPAGIGGMAGTTSPDGGIDCLRQVLTIQSFNGHAQSPPGSRIGRHEGAAEFGQGAAVPSPSALGAFLNHPLKSSFCARRKPAIVRDRDARSRTVDRRRDAPVGNVPRSLCPCERRN